MKIFDVEKTFAKGWKQSFLKSSRGNGDNEASYKANKILCFFDVIWVDEDQIWTRDFENAALDLFTFSNLKIIFFLDPPCYNPFVTF